MISIHDGVQEKRTGSNLGRRDKAPEVVICLCRTRVGVNLTVAKRVLLEEHANV